MKVIDFNVDEALTEHFLAFPRKLYTADPNWLPEPDEKRWLSIVAQRKFLAMIDNEVYGRATVAINPAVRDGNGRIYGQIGFFECVNNLSIASELISAALGWLHSNRPDINTVLAPMNFDTWHAYRLRTSGFGQPSFMMEPYNPSYYPDLFSALNFTILARYVTKTMDDLTNLPNAWEPYYQSAIGHGFTFRSFNPDRASEEMNLIYHLSLDIFRDNLLFADIPEDDFRILYSDIASKINPDLLIILLNPRSEPIGFSLTVPDHRQRGTANLKTMGVLPHENGTGVGAALAYETYRRLRAKSFVRVNHCLMRAGNRADQFDRGQAKITREYSLYTCPIQP